VFELVRDQSILGIDGIELFPGAIRSVARSFQVHTPRIEGLSSCGARGVRRHCRRVTGTGLHYLEDFARNSVVDR